jgi:hypothetical protein
MIVDVALYVDGVRVEGPGDIHKGKYNQPMLLSTFIWKYWAGKYFQAHPSVSALAEIVRLG